jgi:hypothetical protein
MPTLSVEENLLLVREAPGDRPLIQRVPGRRWNTARECWQFPNHPGVILALDRVFGREGWQTADDRAGMARDSARGRELPRARHRAQAQLREGRLAVRCDMADRELVKLVPGYRWLPDRRLWSLEALPLALEILEDGFGGLLEVEQSLRDYLELRRKEEDDMLRRAPPAPAPPLREVAAAPPAAGPGPGPVLTAAAADSERLAAIEASLLRIEQLLALLAAQAAAAAPAPAAPPEAAPPLAPGAPAPEPGPGLEWQRILQSASADPTAAVEEAERYLQTAAPGEQSTARAALALCQRGAGRPAEEVYTNLRRALDPSLEAACQAELQPHARSAFCDTVLELIRDGCGPLGPLGTAEELIERAIDEVIDGSGFDDETIESDRAREILESLVRDTSLAAHFADVSACCRALHLVSAVRGPRRLGRETIADLLREPGTHGLLFALAAVVYANSRGSFRAATDWYGSWPEPFAQDAEPHSWLIGPALEKLRGVHSRLASAGALSVLACIAPEPSDTATTTQRKELTRLVAPEHRPYAEFLAAFRLAAEGAEVRRSDFPGYFDYLENAPLATSLGHCSEVLLMGDRNHRTAAREIANNVLIPAIRRHGLPPGGEGIADLLDLFEPANRPDKKLNELGRMLEDDEIPGSDQVGHAQRVVIYRAALDASARSAEDARVAFARLARQLMREPTLASLRQLCAAHRANRHLRDAVLEAELAAVIEEGSGLDGVIAFLEQFDRPSLAGPSVAGEVEALASLYPEWKDKLLAFLPYLEPQEREPPVDLSGKRLVVVGGSPRLMNRAEPELERYGLEVEWLDSDGAKNGHRLEALIRGCDLVLVNGSYVGHAASERAEAAARAAGRRIEFHWRRGLASLVQHTLDLFAEGAPAAAGEQPEGRRPRKADDRRRKYLR